MRKTNKIINKDRIKLQIKIISLIFLLIIIFPLFSMLGYAVHENSPCNLFDYMFHTSDCDGNKVILCHYGDGKYLLQENCGNYICKDSDCLTKCDSDDECYNDNKCVRGVCINSLNLDYAKGKVSNDLKKLNAGGSCGEEGKRKCLNGIIYQCKDVGGKGIFTKNKWVYERTCESLECKNDDQCKEAQKNPTQNANPPPKKKSKKPTIQGCANGMKIGEKKCMKADGYMYYYTCSVQNGQAEITREKCATNACDDNKGCASIAPKPVQTQVNCKKGKVTSECICGNEKVTSGYCCNGKHSEDPKVCKSLKCDRNKEVPKEGCYCGNEFLTSGYCCKYKDKSTKKYSASSLQECQERKPNCNSDCTEENSRECICPDYCTNDISKKENGYYTCGDYKADDMCEAEPGECMPKKECTDNHYTVSSNNKRNNYCSKTKKGSYICCKTEKSDGKPKRLYNCFTPCDDPDGCNCPKECKDEEGNIISYKNKAEPHIKAPYNCGGSIGFSNPCSGTERDYQCPSGCFWFNDRDCGPDVNLGNVLWDYLAKDEWRKEYEKKWIKNVEDIGAYFNPDNWVESTCNKESGNYKNEESTKIDVYYNHRAVGWIAANRQPYGSDESLYTVSWLVSDLPENNTAKLVFAYNSKEYVNKTINISKGESKSEQFAWHVPYLFNKICMKFDKEICLGEGFDKRCYKNICRNIIEIK